MPRRGLKMKGGETNEVTIGTQKYNISSEEVDGQTKICVSVPKPKAAAEESDKVETPSGETPPGETLPGETLPAVIDSDGGKRRRGGKTAKKGGKSAKKGGKTGGTRKRGGRKGGKK